MHSDDIVLVPLTQGKVAIIDAADAGRVLAYRWWYAGRYAVRCGHRDEGLTGHDAVYLHCWLTDCPEDTDHINGDTMNCRQSNLRCATHLQNGANRRLGRNSTSGYKGVSWHKATERWQARIRVNYERIYLGLFATAEDAARAYDSAAREHFKEYASLNFPDE